MKSVNPFVSLTYPLFEYVLWCERSYNPNESSAARERDNIIGRFSTFENQAKTNDLLVEDILAVKYALTAFIDEKMKIVFKEGKNKVRSDSEPNDFNTSVIEAQQEVYSPLQIDFFGEHSAGEGFFNKLSMLRQEANINVIEIYYLCLQLGFEGDYRFIGKDKLTALKVDVRAQIDGLNKNKIQSLSVDVLPKDGLFVKVSKSLPSWVFAAIFSSCIIVMYISFSLAIESSSTKSLKRINDYYISHASFKPGHLNDHLGE
jgi:type VI secretion system protein ImpK